MYDPCTVAHEIKYPWKKWGEGRTEWERNFRDTFITIWHVDPEKREGKVCRRYDDTCGWSAPNPTQAEYDAIRKLAQEQYRQIFERQAREAEGASYARLCNVPTIFDAIYWSWRAIKRYKKYSPARVMWQYGYGLTAGEFEQIISLASNPVDSLKYCFADIKDEDGFISLFMSVYRAYSRHHRPWYKHPRWHFWHWRIQLHPWQNLKRRFWTKCCKCGKRGFKRHQQAIGNWSGTEIWHSTCDGGGIQAGQKEAA